MYRKEAISALLLLMILTASASGRVLVVDRAGSGEFKTLSGAVASSRPGDVITMLPGSYRDSVVLDRQLTIQGQGSVINGLRKSAFRVTSAGCSISNLTIEGSGDNPGVSLEARNSTIKGCTIRNCTTGIAALSFTNIMENKIEASSYGIVLAGKNIVVSSNEVFGASVEGISAQANNSTFAGNRISSSGIGFNFSGKGNSISGNDIRGCNLGLSARGSRKNVIKGNTILRNQIAGIYLEDCTNNEIDGNEATKNGNGILLKLGGANNITSNILSSNSYGIALKGSPGNDLRTNRMEKNSYNLQVEAGDLGDLRLLSSISAGSKAFESFVQRIDRSNTADGRQVLYLVGEKNAVIPKDCGYVGLIDCRNISVGDQSISNSSAGILMVNPVECRVDNCTLVNNGIGIYLLGAADCVLSNNVASNSEIGFWIGRSSGVRLTSNKAELSKDSGFRLEGDRRVSLSRCIASSCNVGMSLQDSMVCEVVRSNVSDNKDRGMRLIRSHKTLIKENEATRNAEGITLSGSDECIIAYNNVSMNQRNGILVEQLSGGRIAGNTMMNNREGIFLQSSDGLFIQGNEVRSNSRYGLRMSISRGCNVTENVFSDNVLAGVGLTDCEGNRIYHNSFLDNGVGMAQNAVDNGKNEWDMGPTVGGNYWSDHPVFGNPGKDGRSIPSKGIDRYPFQDKDGWRKSQ